MSRSSGNNIGVGRGRTSVRLALNAAKQRGWSWQPAQIDSVSRRSVGRALRTLTTIRPAIQHSAAAPQGNAWRALGNSQDETSGAHMHRVKILKWAKLKPQFKATFG